MTSVKLGSTTWSRLTLPAASHATVIRQNPSAPCATGTRGIANVSLTLQEDSATNVKQTGSSMEMYVPRAIAIRSELYQAVDVTLPADSVSVRHMLWDAVVTLVETDITS